MLAKYAISMLIFLTENAVVLGFTLFCKSEGLSEADLSPEEINIIFVYILVGLGFC